MWSETFLYQRFISFQKCLSIKIFSGFQVDLKVDFWDDVKGLIFIGQTLPINLDSNVYSTQKFCFWGWVRAIVSRSLVLNNVSKKQCLWCRMAVMAAKNYANTWKLISYTILFKQNYEIQYFYYCGMSLQISNASFINFTFLRKRLWLNRPRSKHNVGSRYQTAGAANPVLSRKAYETSLGAFPNSQSYPNSPTLQPQACSRSYLRLGRLQGQGHTWPDRS